MRVVVIRPGGEPAIEEIDPGLKSMQQVVGGPVDCVRLAEGVDLWVNDEGAVNDMPFNRLVEGQQPIWGPMFIARSTATGDTTGLSESDAAEWVARAAAWTTRYPGFGD